VKNGHMHVLVALIHENRYICKNPTSYTYLHCFHSPHTMEASTGLFAGSPNSKELVAIQGPDEVNHRETRK